ncbi:hypothetical protein Glo7428_4184 [Gloeocapsa sp. PCC 7428]|nr:hypothetical protein Glo7428_4184 [Gloeocapsa sp. PCC 7428]
MIFEKEISEVKTVVFITSFITIVMVVATWI